MSISVVLLKEAPSGSTLTLDEQRMNGRRAHAETCPFVARQREQGITYYAHDAGEATKAGVLKCTICGGQ